MNEERRIFLDGFAAAAGKAPFDGIARQPPPTDPRIKLLLGKALVEPASLRPEEVREMAASVVYHLLAQKRAVETDPPT